MARTTPFNREPPPPARLIGAVKRDGDEGTVRNYLSAAISKLGASNRIEAARLARRRGWL